MSVLEFVDFASIALSSLAYAGAALLTLRVYTTRPDLVPLRLVSVGVLYLAFHVLCQLARPMLPLEIAAPLSLAVNATGLVVVLGFVRYLPRYAGMHQDELARRRMANLLLQGFPAVSFLIDEEMNILFAEGMALRVAGFSPPDLLGRNLKEFIKNPEVLELYERALAGKKSSLVHPGTPGTPSGRRKYITTTAPVRSDGRRLAMAATMDLTEVRALGGDFEEQLVRLRVGG